MRVSSIINFDNQDCATELITALKTEDWSATLVMRSPTSFDVLTNAHSDRVNALRRWLDSRKVK